MLQVAIEDSIPQLLVALIEVENAAIGPAKDDLRRACDEAARTAVSAGLAGGETRRSAIRDLLRSGGFKPSGRSKPSQEYLLRTAHVTGTLPSIGNAVDLINLLSLQSGLPISLVSLDRVGTQLSLRFGRAGERYVFNRTGQELVLDGLLCLCTVRDGRSTPVGTPVKDSMFAKVDETDRHLLACLYAAPSAIARDELRSWAEQLGAGFLRFCGAAEYRVTLLPEE